MRIFIENGEGGYSYKPTGVLHHSVYVHRKQIVFLKYFKLIAFFFSGKYALNYTTFLQFGNRF